MKKTIAVLLITAILVSGCTVSQGSGTDATDFMKSIKADVEKHASASKSTYGYQKQQPLDEDTVVSEDGYSVLAPIGSGSTDAYILWVNDKEFQVNLFPHLMEDLVSKNFSEGNSEDECQDECDTYCDEGLEECERNCNTAYNNACLKKDSPQEFCTTNCKFLLIPLSNEDCAAGCQAAFEAACNENALKGCITTCQDFSYDECIDSCYGNC